MLHLTSSSAQRLVQLRSLQQNLCSKLHCFSAIPTTNGSRETHFSHSRVRIINAKSVNMIYGGVSSRTLSWSSITGWFYGSKPSATTPAVVPVEPLPPPATPVEVPPLETFIPEPSAAEIEHVYNALGEPTLNSLGLGCWYTPAGWMQHVLEFLHVQLDVPWWAAVTIFVATVRLCLFPWVIKQRKQMMEFTTKMPLFVEMQQKLVDANNRQDYIDMIRYSKEVQKLGRPQLPYKLMMFQVPLFMGVFFGLKRMADLPVPSLLSGGLFWFQDFTIADPYFILPLFTAATMHLMFRLGIDVATPSSKFMRPFFLYGFPLLTFGFTYNFPAALCFYWATTNVISLLQGIFLRQEVVAKYFGIEKPKLPKANTVLPAQKKGWMESFRESTDANRALANLQDRDKRNDDAWLKAAKMGPVKTFATKEDALKAKAVAVKKTA